MSFFRNIRVTVVKHPIMTAAAVYFNLCLIIMGSCLGAKILTYQNTSANFATQVPAEEDSTWACYLPTGTKVLQCNDYMTVTIEILKRQNCVCRGKEESEEL